MPEKTNQPKGVRILSFEAKDIVNGNINDRFFTDSLTLKKFTNTLDYSLDLIKLREVDRKVHHNSYFSFEQDGQEYTTKVINVTFQYNNKEYNRIKNIYLAHGYILSEITLQDHAAVAGGKLIAIETGQEVAQPLPAELLGKNFYYQNGTYHAANTIPVLHNTVQLRTALYQDGFVYQGVRYVRFKRSAGSSRVGKCLFIEETLYSRMHTWEMCGLRIRKGQRVNLAALESYLALTLSSIIGTLDIQPQQILVIDDYESCFTEDVIETTLNGSGLETRDNRVEIRNSIWDGQSLLDQSLFGSYAEYGMLLLRNRFFKSCCFQTDIQKWFAHQQITNVSQLKGITLAGRIEDIKLITTPSSIKYLKFGTLEQWLARLEPSFGIVKHEKPTHFFDGRLVQTHYQLLNTLQLDETEMTEFLQPSLDYLKLLKTDPAVLRYHVKYPEDAAWNNMPLVSKNDIVYRLLGLNERFAQTRLYNDFKKELTAAYVRNLRLGHVLVCGNYSTLFGNPVEMLRQAIGRFDGTPQMEKGAVYSLNFAPGQPLLCCRSPHVTMGNLWLPVNRHNREIDTYFHLTKEIVCINSIGEAVLDRLSGCDFDSDTVLLTDDEILLQAARKHYRHFKLPVNHVDSVVQKRKYTAADQTDLDIRTSENKIGEIINLSQELNTLFWHCYNNGTPLEQLNTLYQDICQLDVMSGIEIDKAKKEFAINTYAEMQKIRAKYLVKDDAMRTVKPNFFGHLARQKGYYDPLRINYQRHDTAMDYLQKIINQFQRCKNGISNTKAAYLPFADILKQDTYNIKNVNYDQVHRIISAITDCLCDLQKLYANETLAPGIKYTMVMEKKEKCASYIGRLKINSNNMLYLLFLLEDQRYKKISRCLFHILFGYPNTSFFNLIRESAEHIPIFAEVPAGSYRIFGIPFEKINVG